MSHHDQIHAMFALEAEAKALGIPLTGPLAPRSTFGLKIAVAKAVAKAAA